MPARDGTGPRGRGSMTGRGRGDCRGTDERTYDGPPFGRGRGTAGRGRGFGRGGGRGRNRGFDYPGPPPHEEADFLRAESERLKQQLDGIEKRLAEFEKRD